MIHYDSNHTRFDGRGFLKDPMDMDLAGNPSRQVYDPDTMVDTGNWILLVHRVPVAVPRPPRTYGIYWAVPYVHARTVDGETKTFTGVDESGRQCALIYTPDEVKVFPDEYRILDERKLEEYKSSGWELHETNADVPVPLNMDIIEQGRALCEEERETIWSLMLDGLTEQQSCEEYFLSKHSDYNNTAICYLLPPAMQAEVEGIFGE